jgi:hypothetical protein
MQSGFLFEQCEIAIETAGQTCIRERLWRVLGYTIESNLSLPPEEEDVFESGRLRAQPKGARLIIHT